MSDLLQVRGLRKVFALAPGHEADATGPGWLRRARPRLLHAVDGVDLDIRRGETVGLVGESGCGKSTLVRLIARLAEPTSGSVRLGGSDITAIDAARFSAAPERRQVQMVFQDPTESLNPRFTAFDVIADPLRRLERLRGSQLDRRTREAAEMVGLAAELLSRFPHQLSGGQKARVGIARAIAVRPQLVLLDEPTSAVDVSVQALILQLLDRLRQQLAMSYLFVSHDLGVVRLLCHRVAVMYLGRIVESGPTEEVFRRPAHPYTRMLLAAVPSLEPRARTAAARVVGEPGSPIDPDPRVCRFAGRCPDEVAICRQAMPELRDIGPGHGVACHVAPAAATIALDSTASPAGPA